MDKIIAIRTYGKNMHTFPLLENHVIAFEDLGGRLSLQNNHNAIVLFFSIVSIYAIPVPSIYSIFIVLAVPTCVSL